MEERNYLDNFIIKEQDGKYGNFLKVWIPNLEELIKSLQEMENNNSVNLIISKRREKSEKGVSHFTYQDNWKPESKGEVKIDKEEDVNFDELFSDTDEDMPFVDTSTEELFK